MADQPPRPSPPEREITLADKVAFLSRPEAYPDDVEQVETRETHMSWVFLAGRRVYKLKKPIKYASRDGRSLRVRERLCREEVRLNRRLAETVYLGVASLDLTPGGDLVLGGGGQTQDWLVVMQRLPEHTMLDVAIARGTVTRSQVARIAERLTQFYRGLAPEHIAPEAYVAQFVREQEENRAVLTDPRFGLPSSRVEAVLARVMRNAPGLLEQRAREGRIVEGHGDLRPEHVCLSEPPVIIDCLEFSRALRQVDPFDELAFLSMECERLGAPWIGRQLIRCCAQALDDRPAAPLLAFYTAYRACLRARLALSHLLDSDASHPEKWQPLAQAYLAMAEKACASLAPPAVR